MVNHCAGCGQQMHTLPITNCTILFKFMFKCQISKYSLKFLKGIMTIKGKLLHKGKVGAGRIYEFIEMMTVPY